MSNAYAGPHGGYTVWGLSFSILILLSIFLLSVAVVLYLGWQILGRLGRKLQVANISLLQSEIKEVTYRHRINEAVEKCRRLEQKLQETQYELLKARDQA
ncbi:hypothetical protein CLV59_104593 [Chitinophaga dinghuensis]|uniref:Uncharacterized protein n=1 Tax=Chitinophaga dinghuensis TaxID=1539050 RepID=A0A327W242_9BACT|nr:hypothetical protein [Chitinophaga dinghuensis]RAJ82366.1 hypothetical protein CLV59_104593 [Chitinophaga dinghuensis]